MLSYFKSQLPATIVAFILFFLVLKIPFLLHGTIFPVVNVQSLWNSNGLLADNSFILNFLLAQICLLIQAFWFNYLFNQADYHESNTMLPALFYAICTSLLPEFNQFSIYTIIGFLLLALFQIALNINSRESAKLESFNLGLVGGILVLVNIHFIVLIPFLFVMLYALKSFRISEYIMLFFGIFFIAYLGIGLSYLLDVSINLAGFSFKNFYLFRFQKNTFNIILLIMTALYLCFSFISLRGIMFSTGFKRRKNVNMLVLYFLALAFSVAFAHNSDESNLSLLFIPVACFLTLFMLRIRKKRLGEILNAIFITVTIVTNIVRFLK